MKTFASVIAVGTLGLCALCDLCQPSASASAAVRGPAQPVTALATGLEQKTIALRIEGMTCGGCAIATRKALARLPGVSAVHVSYGQKQAVVTYDPAKVTPAGVNVSANNLGGLTAKTPRAVLRVRCNTGWAVIPREQGDRGISFAELGNQPSRSLALLGMTPARGF